MTRIALDEVAGLGVPPGKVGRFDVAFADRADGSPATFPLIVVEGHAAGPTALLTAGIHGDEYEGPRALWALADQLPSLPVRGRVLMVPMANLDAFSAGTRTSPTDGQNLARIFPGDPQGTLTFRLAAALFEVVRMADVLVDLHSGGVRLAFMEVCGFYSEGPGVTPELAARSLSLARAMGLQRLWRLPARAGVLSYEALRAGIPAIGAESGGRGGQIQDDVDGYAAGLLRVLRHEGILPDLPPDIPAGAPATAAVLDGDWALAPCGGFIESFVSPGQAVEAGHPLAVIRSPSGEILADLRAGEPGIVMGVRHLASIQPGEWATCVVREVLP
jgi:predicted deacylase